MVKFDGEAVRALRMNWPTRPVAWGLSVWKLREISGSECGGEVAYADEDDVFDGHLRSRFDLTLLWTGDVTAG